MEQRDSFATLPLRNFLWLWLNSLVILRWQRKWVEKPGGMSQSHSLPIFLASV
uniref:Uncharacterized protein n=1 Tax=Rhizophora mucronata TaxID=61149 RepID=A0A2P2NPC4_RHIMU